MKCRHCQTDLVHSFVDLGSSPPSNSYLGNDALQGPETWYPLHVLICDSCWLVQTADFAKRDEFFSADYAYFSSFSDSWLKHAKHYVETMAKRFSLGGSSHIVEVASNDGYLLQYAKALGIPCLGVEPTASTAKASRDKGIDTIEEFFGTKLAHELVAQGLSADLTAANNVLAHVPDIDDFVAGFAVLLKLSGVATFEFPHLMKLVAENQFDTIYHEHYSYLSLTAVNRIFARNGLTVFGVEEISTHGGSLRVFACRSDCVSHPVEATVGDMLEREAAAGVSSLAYYRALQAQADRVASDLLEFLIDKKREGKSVAAYGAAAKGNTLLNFAGVRPNLLPWVVDRNPAKQDKYLPGSRIPIVAEERIRAERPDYVLILPWNLADEVTGQLSYIREWGGQFVCAIPKLRIL
jgi:C-methyltransferase C-terminal domain/Putative zinc binding domain/Methyltransferase domain